MGKPSEKELVRLCIKSCFGAHAQGYAQEGQRNALCSKKAPNKNDILQCGYLCLERARKRQACIEELAHAPNASGRAGERPSGGLFRAFVQADSLLFSRK
ncbi:uncharacterized protein NEMAJ01_1057 [Nematocida major]|uniref:uncharacterized protein n=1 Tax=Nematocida major TaxID=1912982 RepID=UPI0020083587|nr:uncharacterized protein NEMAJ01_1057 [Nematocida major]KAH9386161.1 hypothetical protein NEMAJ01_1057 [Nematocida major]